MQYKYELKSCKYLRIMTKYKLSKLHKTLQKSIYRLEYYPVMITSAIGRLLWAAKLDKTLPPPPLTSPKET